MANQLENLIFEVTSKKTVEESVKVLMDGIARAVKETEDMPGIPAVNFGELANEIERLTPSLSIAVAAYTKHPPEATEGLPPYTRATPPGYMNKMRGIDPKDAQPGAQQLPRGSAPDATLIVDAHPESTANSGAAPAAGARAASTRTVQAAPGHAPVPGAPVGEK